MICCGFDAYNQASTGSVSKSLTNKATDSDHTPVVAVDVGGLQDFLIETPPRQEASAIRKRSPRPAEQV